MSYFNKYDFQKLNNLITYLVSITTKFPVQCVCGNPKILSLHTIQSPRWYFQRLRSQFTLIPDITYIHIKIYLLFKIIDVWRIQIKYPNMALTFTEISGKLYNRKSTSTVKYAIALYFMKLLFVTFGRSCRSCIFCFRKFYNAYSVYLVHWKALAPSNESSH